MHWPCSSLPMEKRLVDKKWLDRGLVVFMIVLLILTLAPSCSIQISLQHKSADSGDGKNG